MKLINHTFNECILNLKSGLSKEVLSEEKNVDIEFIEQDFRYNNYIETSLLGNKSYALANKLCLQIFKTMADKFNLCLEPPPAIYLYRNNQLLDTNSSANFCIPDTKEVLKNEYPFLGRSVFFKEFENLKEIDDNTELQFKNKINSSPHFLAPFIHEWLHSFQLDYIFKKFGYGGNCQSLNEIYPRKNLQYSGIYLLKMLQTKKLSSEENKIIGEELGYYSMLPYNQYLEIFSETFTKFICNSLKNCILVKNPFEQLKNTSSAFKNILIKVCLFK